MKIIIFHKNDPINTAKRTTIEGIEEAYGPTRTERIVEGTDSALQALHYGVFMANVRAMINRLEDRING